MIINNEIIEAQQVLVTGSLNKIHLTSADVLAAFLVFSDFSDALDIV